MNQRELSTKYGLTFASKMPGPSWSLPAGYTCPGHKLREVCQICYAKGRRYRFPNVIKAYKRRLEMLKDLPTWIENMSNALNDNGIEYFRWHDSGDIYNGDYAVAIRTVIENTPTTQHWIPSKMHKYESVFKYLPNCIFRYSSPNIDEVSTRCEFTSTVVSVKNTSVDGFRCPASFNKTNCGFCRKCWSEEPVILYLKH
jgi:hypothetical protein